jgi:hypothetical protein
MSGSTSSISWTCMGMHTLAPTRTRLRAPSLGLRRKSTSTRPACLSTAAHSSHRGHRLVCRLPRRSSRRVRRRPLTDTECLRCFRASALHLLRRLIVVSSLGGSMMTFATSLELSPRDTARLMSCLRFSRLEVPGSKATQCRRKLYPGRRLRRREWRHQPAEHTR